MFTWSCCLFTTGDCRQRNFLDFIEFTMASFLRKRFLKRKKGETTLIITARYVSIGDNCTMQDDRCTIQIDAQEAPTGKHQNSPTKQRSNMRKSTSTLQHSPSHHLPNAQKSQNRTNIRTPLGKPSAPTVQNDCNHLRWTYGAGYKGPFYHNFLECLIR